VSEIVTPRFLRTALGIHENDATERARALAALDLGPLAIEIAGPVTRWSDGRGAVDVRYRRGAYQIVAARWFLVAERGIARFDEESILPPPPLGDRVTIGFAIADDRQPLHWSSPARAPVPPSPVIALHGANRGNDPHTFILDDASGRTVGLLTLPPWTQGDLLLLALPAGTYRLHDPAVPASALTLEVGSGF
jgi:hypothetical protein